MRTTLDIDDELMRALMDRHPGASKREAVENAIREFLRSDAVVRLRALSGKVEVDDTYLEMRKADEERQRRIQRMWQGEG
jgi:Arc/MetJ family transcription regulator